MPPALKPPFDLAAAAQTVRMGRARFVNPANGAEIFVTAPGASSYPGDIAYNPSLHKNDLCCEQCAARVRFRPASETAIAGSSLKGNEASFVTKVGETHAIACEYYTLPTGPRARASIDKEKGYRLHLNTAAFSDLYTQVEGVYSRKGAIIKINDDDLKDREIYGVRSIGDLVAFMASADNKRVNDSVVIFGNVRKPWPDFFVRYNRKGNTQPRFTQLVEALKGGGPEGTFCMMEMQVARPRVYSSYEKNLTVYSRKVPYLIDSDGTKRDIVPSATLNRLPARHNTHLASAFSFGNHYLALGIVRLNETKDGPFYLNMSINDPRQVSPVNIENIARQAALRAKNSVSSVTESVSVEP